MVDYAKQRVTMVDTQVRPSDVTKFPIIDAMLDVPREAFVPDARRDMAYVGGPIEIAPGRVLLDGRTIAKMLDAADLEPGDVVLEIGCGPWLLHGASGAYRRCGRRGRAGRNLAAEAEDDPVRPRGRQCRGGDRTAGRGPCQGRPLRRDPDLRRGRGCPARCWISFGTAAGSWPSS
jgi:hypothetical protein